MSAEPTCEAGEERRRRQDTRTHAYAHNPANLQTCKPANLHNMSRAGDDCDSVDEGLLSSVRFLSVLEEHHVIFQILVDEPEGRENVVDAVFGE